ncbi:MAG: sensor histidine kinase, partial [Peptococcaceae bacterium]
ETGSMFIFLDCTVQQESVQSFLYLSCGIALIVFLVVFLLVYMFSPYAIAPVVQTMEKQKQFITDAGHELKTPLAIISANADVLALYQENNQWLESIRNQVERMNDLVQELLTLARLEEQQKPELQQLDLSELTRESAAPFAVLAGRKQAAFQLQIEPQIMLQGDGRSLRQLVSVLVDNSVKYVQQGGRVTVTLQKKGRAAQLEVYNSCDIVPEGDLELLFDRFRRTDLSRARESGGSGIGLSVARAVVEAHHGKIYAERKN